MNRCQLCGAPCGEAQVHCSKPCASAARVALKDGIEARVRRAFQRRRRAPGPPPDPEAEQILFEIEGFWTPGCAGAAEEVLRCSSGVLDAHIVGDTGRGRAFFDPERITAAAILDILRRYGFRASLIRDAWARSEGFSRSWELMLAVRLGVSVTLAMIVTVLTLLLGSGHIADDHAAGTVRVLMMFLSVPVLAYGGFPIFFNAAWAVARRRVTADLLTAAAAAGAFVLSLPAVADTGAVHFDAACAAVVLTLFARLCEYRARRRVARVGERLVSMVSGPAVRLRKGEEIPCGAAELRPGDVVLVAAGARVPADGDVVEGGGVLEPAAGGRVEISPGDRVAAGSRLTTGRLVVRAERTGAATSAGEFARLVEGSLASRMPGAPAVSSGLVWLGAATATFGLLALGYETGNYAALLSVLLATSPSALALLPSIAGLSAMGRAAESLVCFRSGEAVNAAARADGVVLSRSALLEPRATADAAAIAGEPAEFWSVVASLVAVAQGPAAAAIRERARSEGASPALAVPPQEGPLSRARVDGRDAAGGDRAAMEALGWEMEPGARRALAEEERGRTLFWAGWDGRIRGAVSVDAADRPGAAEIGGKLKRAGVLTCLAGADADAALDAQAARLGLDTWMSEAALAEGIARRRANGRRTAVALRAAVDAPAAVEAADLAMALDCAEEGPPDWAGVVALGADVGGVDVALGAARRAERARKVGGTAAFLYHTAALPCAAAGLLSPMVAVGMGAVCALWLIHAALRAGGNPEHAA
ncbi:MAG: cation-translocating P-type ATPase [Planctomycetia bacterium]|nr:cation-translocating P-type ATPase [Planctomycetia bacterium]